MLLPVVLLAGRADTAAVIGAGLTAKATGAGHRLIAALLGRPAETVRGWLRRFAGRVEAVRAVFTGGAGTWRPIRCCPGRPGRRGAGALAAVLVAAAALAARFGIGEVPPWQAAAAISAARLLSPGWPSPDGRS